VRFRFTVSDSVRQNAALKDPLVGTIYGDLFLAEDVSVFGPRDDAEAIDSIPPTMIDLRTEQISEAEVIRPFLAPATLIFLGFFDVDNNPGPEGNRRPEQGDPATLARTNLFTITAGTETKRLVAFELVYN
jgi:hypothetical protein